jgi:HEPN domain-containing protein
MTEASKIKAPQWRLAVQWPARADGDMRIARAIVMHESETLWGAALHCQQATEKIEKGLLIAFGIRPPRTHNIEALAELVQQRHPALGEQIAALGALTAWYFVTRYPSGVDESLPSLTDIQTTIDKIEDLREQVDALAPKPSE